ncbi:TetR/AcrR family transcriptional regulator [Nocardioides sp. T2.26MG-1]|uniref:TetR/AcrR family transcriptional regulator n=1 Tax=Nocardioides sp. T2.26MG-1 TaxID=3041166 RepID=UPI0024779599|nr:helix-turn-helix domain-containing protein [Nocardioides sp. T2.26MG-1]CAI9418815.1 HTH-type transcriptional regulator BetI [Nocardioides sp. T2.26MG-1]
MSEHQLLPLLTGPPPERRDAARNREALLVAARELVERDGVQAVTMDAVAAAAGVGKGTVFRRFRSKEGLMAAVLDHSETEWQRLLLFGPPPLGPGAPPWERLVAFGRSRLETTLLHADLIRAAGAAGTRSSAAYSLVAMHVRYLLAELGVTGDLPLLATALLAPMEIPILDQQLHNDGFPIDRVHAGWVDLARRIVGDAAPPR